VPDFNALLQMLSGVHFSFFGSFVFASRVFLCPMSPSRPSLIKWLPVATKQNESECSAWRTFGKRIE